MIPIRDTIRSENFPLVNFLIIGVNVIAFLWELSLGPGLNKALFTYGIVPQRYSDPSLSLHFTMTQQLVPFVTSMFLHGGVFHILGNMWFLYIFGDNVEDRLGHLRYLLFYVLCGVLAGVAHLLTNWDSGVPTIGASGAIAGVMGAYFITYPRARIVTLIPLFFFFQFAELPAFLFLGLWFLMQLFSAGLSDGGSGGIAWWAHIGGFVCGIVLFKLFQALPRMGVDTGLRRHTRRRSTPRLHTISARLAPEELDLYGAIRITPREAALGAKKLISVDQGLRKRTVMVTIPPAVEEGTVLRLRGLGRKGPEGQRGDLYLEILLWP
jgi:membrane associated rhomboid family serine protease